MDYFGEMNWYAIQTRSHKEDVAAAWVAKLHLEVFLPMVRRIQSVCGVSRFLTKPLFPGYFFSRFSPLINVDAVRYSPCVLRVVGTNRFPIPLEPEIISEIRERTGPDGLIHLESRCYPPGSCVRVEQGPFEGFIGKVEGECDDGRRVMILLEAIQHARLLVEKGWLAAAAPV
jgi:transcription antitermination factor NusG